MVNRRPGYSLVEVLVVITISVVMLSTITTLLHTLLRAEQNARDEAVGQALLERLGGQFRNDVHAAIRLQTLDHAAGPPTGGEFELPASRTVRYENQADGILRTERLGQAVERRKSFRLPAQCVARIEMLPCGPPKIVSLWIGPREETATPPPGVPVRFEAVLARDHRFAQPEEP
jgi:prepilin-type N-terminal cleavage/methylation domain-containing protein